MEWCNFAVRVDTGVEVVKQGIYSGSRTGYPFVCSGCGYATLCFFKDVQALVVLLKLSDITTQRFRKYFNQYITHRIRIYFNIILSTLTLI